MAATKTSKASESNNPFIKQLASSNRTTRDRALSSLRTYLSRPQPLTPLDLLKLWKGLHYCMFMSDKPRNQQRLARDLADLVDCFNTTQAKFEWIGTFWKTISREWSGIDSLRMDKYLYMIRCYVNKGLEVCKKSKWSQETVQRYSSILSSEGGPLSARDSKVPVGLRLHVLDVWVDELEKVDAERQAPVESVMEPVIKLGKDSLVKSVRERAREQINDERLVEGKAWAELKESEDEDEEPAKAGDDSFGGFDE